MSTALISPPTEERQPEDEAARLAILIPCYQNVSTAFAFNLTQLVAEYAATSGWNPPLVFAKGPYVTQNMRFGVRQLLQRESWERLLVIETDMVLPRDALWQHALHTGEDLDIVGSVYFQHAPPFHMNAMAEHPDQPGHFAHFTPHAIRHMLEHPALYKVDVISFGCTSIARRVLEEWPADSGMFWQEYLHEASADEFTSGEVSHDVVFSREARALGRQLWLDSRIVCNHLTEAWTNASQFMAANEVRNRETRRALSTPKGAGRLVGPDGRGLGTHRVRHGDGQAC